MGLSEKKGGKWVDGGGDGSVEEYGWVDGDGLGEEERSSQTSFTSNRDCRHDSEAVGQWLVLGFIGGTSLLPLA